jgi:predicted ATPase
VPAESEAVRLFLQRTRAMNPAFALSDANADAVVEIVRRLDGLPLAIELVAARGALFSPPALLARLEHRLPQLTGGPQNQLARHQTMRAAIAWSYDLLAPEKQAIFRALGTVARGHNWTNSGAPT